MARIPTIGQEVALRAPGGQRLQSFDSGAADNLARGVSALAGGVAQIAKAKDDFQARVDEATANDLDAAFGQAAREIESPFLQAQGKNAVDAAKATLESWQQTQANFLARATNERQKGMLGGVLNRRLERFQNQYNSHLTQETEKWQTSAEDSRSASLAVDVVNAPIGSEERALAFAALDGHFEGVAMRRGIDVQPMRFAAKSDVHVSTLQSLVSAGEAQQAKDYFTANEEHIDPQKRPGLSNSVRELDYDWRAEMMVNDSFDINETPTVDVAPQGGTRETVRFQPPVSSAVGSRFGARRSPGGVGSTNHKGVDFPIPPNTPVTASLPGVVRIKQDPDGYGNYVVIDHGNGLETRYAHLNRYNVRDGQSVGQGDVIALSGGMRGAAGAGNSQGAHLHFEVRRNGQPVDPSTVFNQNTAVAPPGGSSGAPSARGAIVTEQDITDWAEKNSGGDWRFRRVLEGRARQRLNGERAGRADAEGEAQRALEAYLPGGANEVADLSQIPATVRASVSPAALRSAANQIEANEKEKAGGESVKTDQELYADLINTRYQDPAAFAQLDLGALAPYMSASDLRSMRTDQAQIRARPDTAENNPRRAALQTALPQIRQMAQQAGIVVGAKAKEEDQALLNGLLTYSRQEIEAFIEREDRVPTQEDVARIVGRGLQQREGARTGLFGLGGREQQYNFATIVPAAAQAQIVSRYRAAANGANPSADQIREIYMLGRARGEFR